MLLGNSVHLWTYKTKKYNTKYLLNFDWPFSNLAFLLLYKKLLLYIGESYCFKSFKVFL